MSTKEQEQLQQQKERRKRINKMKSRIVFTIAFWMLGSFIAIIVLIAQTISLNRKISKLEKANVGNQYYENDTESATVNDNIITGIDTQDNLAAEGDAHQVYLTFDCEPSENTDALLDELAKYNVKATFFVSGDDSEETKRIYKRIVDEGHTLGMHSYSNQYSTVYVSKDAFYNDYAKLSTLLEETTGQKPLFYRFPGGSGNQITNVDMVEFVRVLNQEQITYFDWNVSAGDAASDYTVDGVVNNVANGVSKYKTSVVLLHDDINKSTTVEAIGPLIERMQEMQAELLPIDENTYLIQYIKSDSVE